MQSATESKKIALEYQRAKEDVAASREITALDSKIKDAAKKGLMRLEIYGEILSATSEKLKEMGYKVTFVAETRHVGARTTIFWD